MELQYYKYKLLRYIYVCYLFIYTVFDIFLIGCFAIVACMTVKLLTDMVFIFAMISVHFLTLSM